MAIELDTLKAFAPANMGNPSRKTANAMPHTATDIYCQHHKDNVNTTNSNSDNNNNNDNNNFFNDNHNNNNNGKILKLLSSS